MMKRSLSPEQLDRICFEIQSAISQADDLSKKILHILAQVEGSDEAQHLHGFVFQAGEIASDTLRHKLCALLSILMNELKKRAETVEMREVYAPPAFMDSWKRLEEDYFEDAFLDTEHPGNQGEGTIELMNELKKRAETAEMEAIYAPPSFLRRAEILREGDAFKGMLEDASRDTEYPGNHSEGTIDE